MALKVAVVGARGIGTTHANSHRKDALADLVAASGLSVTELARRIGTSRSRLSTYRSGTVVPSAVMMNRLRRTVDQLTGNYR